MSLRQKTLAIFSLTLLALFIILYLVSRLVLLQSYEQLEKNRSAQNVQRLLNLANTYLENIRATNADYAFWDDTYHYVSDQNTEYIDGNYISESFINLGINFVVILDSDGNRIFDRTIDLQSGEEIDLPQGLDVFLTKSSPFIQAATEKDSAGGLVLLNGKPIFITGQPILTSAHEGPVAGTLIFGRFFDEMMAQGLSEAIELPVRVTGYNAPEMPVDIGESVQFLSAELPTYINVINENTVAGYGLMMDILNRPALILRITMSRDIYAQGESSLLVFAALLVGAGITFAIVTMLLLESTVLSRLTALNASLNTIQETGNISARVNVSGEDEISSVGSAINGMLSTLEENQKSIRAKDEQLQTFVRNAPIMLWAVNKDHQITLLEGVLKLGEAGKSVSEVFENMPEIIQATGKALEGEHISLVLPIGNAIFDVRYTPVKDAEGQITGVIGVATDITERVKAERKLSQAFHDLERQTLMLERAQALYNSTLDHLSDTVNRGSSSGEISEYLDFMRAQFKNLNREQTPT